MWSHRKDKNGLSPLYYRITYNGKRRQISSGIRVTENQWCRRRKKVKNHPLADQLNLELDQIKFKFTDRFLSLKRKKSLITLDKIVQNSNAEKVYKLIDVFKDYVRYKESKIGKHYSKNTYKTLKNTYNLFHKLLSEVECLDISIQELDYKLWKKLVDRAYYHDYATNSINKYFKYLKQVIVFAVERELVNVNKIGHLKLKKEKVEIIALSKVELTLFENYKPVNTKYQKVLHAFLFSCYTGLAHCDLKTFTFSDIETIDGTHWVSVKRRKTNQVYSIPILPKALEIINKYESYGSIPVLSNQKTNQYLKDITKTLGISKNVTSHVGRKTFATTVLLDNGVPLDIVSRLLGHSSSTITQASYAKVNKSLILKYVDHLI